MARRSSSDKFDLFISHNTDLISEYESIDGVMPLEYCKSEIIDKIKQFSKINKGCDFNNTLRRALMQSLTSNQPVTDELSAIIAQYSQEQQGGDINITQIYFNDISRVYKKNKNNYNIEYCEENKDKLIEMNLKTVVSVAKAYQGMGLTLDELISAGNLGLCTAWEKFDISRTKLKDNVLAEIESLPDEIRYEQLLEIADKYFTYGSIHDKFDNHFGPTSTYKKNDVISWVNHNVYNAKFSSVAVMWIRASILAEIDTNSRLVKKPKPEIYKDKKEQGAYQRECLLNLDQPIANGTDTTFSDTLGIEDDTIDDLTVTEAYDEYKEALNRLLDGVCARDRHVILKKFGIGLPRPMLPKEIAIQEGLSIARISQIVQIVADKMRENCVKYNIDPSYLISVCQNFR